MSNKKLFLKLPKQTQLKCLIELIDFQKGWEEPIVEKYLSRIKKSKTKGLNNRYD